MSTIEGTRPSLIAERLVDDRHSLPLSVALHLVPGVLIVAAYLLLGEPLTRAVGCPAFLGWAIALCLILIPIQAGLVWLGYQRNGRLSLEGVLQYTGRPVPRGKLLAMATALIGWMMVLGVVLAPLNDFFKLFFTWLPYANTGGSGNNTYLDLHGYSHSTLLVTTLICLPLTGFTLPLLEEVYFRGFLLPRLAHLRMWAPVVSTVLFALYHLWSPWVFVSRVIFTFPGYWCAWRYNDIRLSIGMHVGVTSIVAAFGTAALVLGLV
ncbi:CPBP family intramembrane glutamic endopeptidase [Nocardia sp. CDC153]|uniref:CPBP family intramembrane glutamic endopeptidase n=1 Tax=Nocardia sp. CDC153 TaxID=3112167 RepID=UPI002DB579EF|nr:CPBP family intramembrane glutamic endopeptidase [Nocardia sp. CDC153]MEC3958894.1 CPBP family intramembrane glutamic endopeptidase [Nocardia sp. CDC153]